MLYGDMERRMLETFTERRNAGEPFGEISGVPCRPVSHYLPQERIHTAPPMTRTVSSHVT